MISRCRATPHAPIEPAAGGTPIVRDGRDPRQLQMGGMCRVIILSVRTPTPQASYRTPAQAVDLVPLSPPPDREPGLPLKAAIQDSFL